MNVLFRKEEDVSVKRESRYEVIETVRRTYHGAPRRVKGSLIAQAVELTGYSRQHVRRLLEDGPPRREVRKRRPGRSRSYKHAVMETIAVAAEATGWICAKRLVAALPDLLPALEKEGAVTVTPSVRTQVLPVSASTIDRRLAAERRAYRPHGLTTTKPGAMLRSQVPIRTDTPWQDEAPGFLEIDLVAHCGDSAAGSFVSTLTAVDIATGWTECSAIPDKRQTSVLAVLHDLRSLFPFPIRGIDCDNGTEFLNRNLVHYCTVKQWTFTRSRPYHKNDQAHVEERNYSVVRQIIGYDRFDGKEATSQMNRIYALLHGYINYYLPAFKLVGKQREGAHVCKQYAPLATPYRRALDSEMLTPGYPTEPAFGPMTYRRLIDKEVRALDTLRSQRITLPTRTAS